MLTSPKAGLSAFIATYTYSQCSAFSSLAPQLGRSTSTPSTIRTKLQSTVDPTTITKKEYQDICGVDFDDKSLAERLSKTSYLYPKHVEVIDDFAPMVDKMVDEIVSLVCLCLFVLMSCWWDKLCVELAIHWRILELL